MISIDFSDGVDDLTRALARRIGTIDTEVQATVTRGALNLKRDWQREAQGHRNLPFLPAAVRVDDITDGKRVSFGDGNQGTLAHIAAFGSYRSAPVMDVFRHIPRELTTIREYMARIGAML